MKKLIAISVIVAFAGLGAIFADAAAGAKIFKKKGCAACHDPAKDQLGSGKGPSLKMIADAYKADGGTDQLITFFNKGKKKTAIVAPKKFGVMKSQLKRIKKMSDTEKSDLADFVMRDRKSVV